MEEAEYLARRAAESGITADDAAAAVAAVTGASPLNIEQLPGGYSAVPFRVTFSDRVPVIVRIAMRADAPYTREAAVLDRVGAAGLPVPTVVGVTRVNGHPVSVLEAVEGRSLLEVMQERGAQDPVVRRRCREAGAVLRSVHDVDPTGLDLPEDGGFYPEVEGFLADYPDPQAVDRVRAALTWCAQQRHGVQPGLVHRDFGPGHVLVNDGGVVAIIDWERAVLGDPAIDVAWWPTHFALPGVTLGTGDDVRVGYGSLPDADFDARVAFRHVVQSVNAAAYAYACGLDGEIGLYLEHLRVALDS